MRKNNTIAYADDIALLADNEEGMRKIIGWKMYEEERIEDKYRKDKNDVF